MKKISDVPISKLLKERLSDAKSGNLTEVEIFLNKTIAYITNP